MPVAEDAFALRDLLPAGTTQLYFESESVSFPKPPDNESHDWDALRLSLNAHKLCFTGESLSRFQTLDTLVRNRFLRATWEMSDRNGLLLHARIYLIPSDLPGLRKLRDQCKALKSLQKALMSIFTYVNRSEKAWSDYSAFVDHFEPFLLQQPDARSLSEIYSDLPSPTIDPSTFLSGTDPRTRKAFKSALYWKSPPGMRPLYPYQVRTVARMLKQELDPGVAPDPLYFPVDGVKGSGKTFYLQPSTMELLREPPMRSQVKGGILCEEMGTGKTCIVLGLIMATIHQLSSPEEALWDLGERPVLTPLSLRHFPSKTFVRARQKARVRDDQSVGLPSLVEMLTHFIRVSPEFIPTKDYDKIKHLHHLWEPLKHNQPFYNVFECIPETASPRRKGVIRGPCKIYLTGATLVVVPRAILGQWNGEINKHCEGGTLRVLLLDNGRKAPLIPSPQTLARDYDIVLLTHERFSAEESHCDISSLYSWEQCNCSFVEQSRVPECVCQVQQRVSPLIQIRWKRLVVDEGHLSATTNNLSRLCQKLNVERRWIVSGTPTRNLMGLSLGQSNCPNEVKVLSQADEDDINSSTAEDERLLYPCRGVDSPRPWTRVDGDDLKKLGDMISKFIGVPQFAHEPSVFQSKVAAPLMCSKGPSFGAIRVVSQVMTQVMFRHQIQDIERELPEKLPPLKEKTVALKFQPLAAKTYNVLQAGIAVNAVDSERKDQDYLFHPTARAALRQTLENLTQAMFWYTDKDMFDLPAALVRSEDALKRALEKNLPESDIKLVEKSIEVQREALADRLWGKVMYLEENPFIVRGLSSALQGAWLKIDKQLLDRQDAILDPDRLCKLQAVLLRSPFISESRLIEHGLGVAAEEERLASLYEQSMRRSKRKAKQNKGVAGVSKVKRFNAAEGSKEKQDELARELSAAIGRQATGEIIAPPPLLLHLPPKTIGTMPLITVLKHAANHKFLIFSAYPLSLAHIEEALRIAKVPCLKYTSGIEPTHREQGGLTFETSDRYRVLLIELKLGARGLNLLAASRIIFCEPVWHGDTELQAIKRALRIGQKRSIKVITLVMRGTSEEAMVTRRQLLRRKRQQGSAMEEDESLSKFLQNPTFIPAENIESPDIPSFDIPLVTRYAPGADEATVRRIGETLVDVAESELPRPGLPSEVDSDRPPKRRKVHFG
ncbi:hypothetical protein K439DRAFT_1618365 [Ramaria rubella]|nr:hypothetical protein K439DRAFT_1618365 [Ramaria rubella]